MAEVGARDGEFPQGNGESSAQKRRILVLGSTSHPMAVTSYTWDMVPPNLNVADYDVVILNFTPFLDEQDDPGVPYENLPDREQFVRLMFSKASEIIAIGSPESKILLNYSSKPYVRMPSAVPRSAVGNTADRPSKRHYENVTWWLPSKPVCIFDGGEQIEVVDKSFSFYFQRLNRWSYHITGLVRSDSYWASHIHAEMQPIAETRFQRAIACQIEFKEVEKDGSKHAPTTKVTARSGPVIWLPPPTEITAEEAINLILKERNGLRFEKVAPEWITAYQLPAEVPIEAEMRRLREEIRQLEAAYLLTEQQLKTEARFRKLLYEQGEDALEPVVRDALRLLGAHVIDPVRRGVEDGTLVDPFGRGGLLEIKGRSGPLKFEDVRQLDFWVRSKLAEEDAVAPKGVLIANLFCSNPPGRRGVVFPDNCVRAAQRLEICLVTTTQLFNALLLHQQGILDVERFWNAVYNTNGVCLLPELPLPEG